MSCRPRSASKAEGCIVVRDMLGRKVEIPKQVKKIVGIRAGALRLLLYMGAHEMIAGIEEIERRGERPYMAAYPELRNLPLIGPSMGGDAELILKAGPELIFMSYTTKEDADRLQRKTGIPVLAIECPEIGSERARLYTSLQFIGKVLDKEKRADALITYLGHTIEELNERTHGISATPSVYVGGVSYSGLHGINSTHPYYPPFIFVNASNVAASIDKRLISHIKGTYIDVEQLLIWNPDYLFIDASGSRLVHKERTENPAFFSMLEAVKNDRLFYLLPYNNYATNYEYVLINAWYAGKILYPEKFPDIDMNEKTDEICMRFLGKKFLNDRSAVEFGFMPEVLSE